MKTYTILVNAIEWESHNHADTDLPGNGVFEIKSAAKPYGTSTDCPLFCSEVEEAVAKVYGFRIEKISGIEVLNEIPGIGKRI